MKNLIKSFTLCIIVCLTIEANGQLPDQYWTDIVTQQPEGYVELESGDVEISSAEGLAWLISVVNGLNGCVADNLEGHSVKLMSDVDLSEGEWTPIGDVYSDSTLVFKGLFDGMRHTIENLFIHDKSYSKQYLGFFGCLSQAEVHNLYLDQGRVFGGSYCGGIAGWSDNGSLVDNCVVNLKVGQCLQFNGSACELMALMGYDVYMLHCYSEGGYPHYRFELNIDGIVYGMEVGDRQYDNPATGYRWEWAFDTNRPMLLVRPDKK
jgi:hypothetical protein